MQRADDVPPLRRILLEPAEHFKGGMKRNRRGSHVALSFVRTNTALRLTDQPRSDTARTSRRQGPKRPPGTGLPTEQGPPADDHWRRESHTRNTLQTGVKPRNLQERRPRDRSWRFPGEAEKTLDWGGRIFGRGRLFTTDLSKRAEKESSFIPVAKQDGD